MAWTLDIPGCDGDLGIERQVTILDWKRDPFVPTEDDG